MQPIIKISNLGKSYWINHRAPQSRRYVALRDVVADGMRNILRPAVRSQEREEFWALKDVNFEVEQGERIGIIGRNGAGKSTLLKILSRITEPTTGRITLRGRVASLLEVGTGFHPELTGRENIFLNGAILGMGRAEIARKFDEIVAFAEVEKFLDTPVKRYSSGMYVRLAFAVAAHLEPEILVVDEVLAVGDAQFQKKCLGKLKGVTKDGRTVLFVSHDMRAILSLCDTGILLSHGSASAKVAVDQAVQQYSSEMTSVDHLLPHRSGELIIHDFQIMQREMVTSECAGELPICIRVDFELTQSVTLFRIGVYVRKVTGEMVFRSLMADWDPSLETLQEGAYTCQLTIPGCLLSKGAYVVRLHTSRFGIIDYLAQYPVEQELAVRFPRGYNEAHPAEPEDNASIILGEPWSLSPMKTSMMSIGNSLPRGAAARVL
jgi:lipopolysaccharide transport system ATP-binding protein